MTYDAYLKKIILWMKTIHYPDRIRSHLVTIVPMASFTSKFRSALHFRYSIVIPHFILTLILLNHNNHYNHSFHNIFDYNHFIYSDYLLYTVTASAYIIR